MTASATVRSLDPEALAAEVERLQQTVLDLGEQLATLTATMGRNQAEVKRLRARVRDLDSVLTLTNAMTVHDHQKLKALKALWPALGLPAKTDAEEFADMLALAGIGAQPGTSAQDDAPTAPAMLQAQREPGAAPLPRGSYEATAAVQARRRQMHAVAAGEGSL